MAQPAWFYRRFWNDENGFLQFLRRKLPVNGSGTLINSVSTPLTGASITPIPGQNNIINPAATIAALTIVLPSNPIQNESISFTFTQAVTTITWSGGTVVGHTSATAGSQFILNYNADTNKWY
jgi:hypothetical protein